MSKQHNVYDLHGTFLYLSGSVLTLPLQIVFKKLNIFVACLRLFIFDVPNGKHNDQQRTSEGRRSGFAYLFDMFLLLKSDANT